MTAQVLGYTVSKFLGIRIIASLPHRQRVGTLLGLLGIAEIALILFAVAPRPLNIACLFLNGLPLGMVFGLVLGFLEGRRMTEAFVAGLCASFILADGFANLSLALATGIGGLGFVGIALAAQSTHSLPGFAFMVLLGLGLYLPYVAVHTTVFERLIAVTRDRGNLGYLMYLADAAGYLGYVIIMLTKGSLGGSSNFLEFFRTVAWIVAGVAAFGFAAAWWQFVGPPVAARIPDHSVKR